LSGDSGHAAKEEALANKEPAANCGPSGREESAGDLKDSYGHESKQCRVYRFEEKDKRGTSDLVKRRRENGQR
jgi:hypothetical protein